MASLLEKAATVKAFNRIADNYVKKLEDTTKKIKEALKQGGFEAYGSYYRKIRNCFPKLNENNAFPRIAHLFKQHPCSLPLIAKKREILNKEIPQWDARTLQYLEKIGVLNKKREMKCLRKPIQYYHWSFEK
jgi:DNA-binding GntR family transcriptional regulator